MNCPLCKNREVTFTAARECERKGYRLICSYCLAETYRAQRPRVWPKVEMPRAVTFFSIEKVRRAA